MYLQFIGLAVPHASVTQAEWLAAVEVAYPSQRDRTLVRRLVRTTHIERRHLAALIFQTRPGVAPLFEPAERQPLGPGFGARSRAFNEASRALVQEVVGRLDRDLLREIDSLITVSCTHASSPGLEIPLMTSFPIPPAVQRWNLGFMGCSAGLAALRLALASSGSAPRALVVTCELSSLHFQYHPELDQMTANALFADGAAAVLLGPHPSRVRLVAARSIALPQFADQMVWFADDYGLRLRLSPELPDTLAAHLTAAVDSFLDHAGVRRGAIQHWMVHPGGPQILDSVDRVLALPTDALEKSRDILRRYGNMSSSTILFILDDVRRSSATGFGLAIAFGPGLTIELLLIELIGK